MRSLRLLSSLSLQGALGAALVCVTACEGFSAGADDKGAGGDATEAPCNPGSIRECYSGPDATKGVGACKPGVQTCRPDGSGFGACEGEVLPEAERCDTPIDDDCNGKVNDACACTPNETVACYSGPVSTNDVGACKSGSAVCQADGTMPSSCTGEVLPTPEVCFNDVDEDCDGNACAAPLWSKMYGSSSAQSARRVAVAPNGDVVIAGSFTNSIDFGGGPLSSAGADDIFVAKFDADGKHLWSKRFGDAAVQTLNDVTVDDDGDVIVVGWFQGQLDFGGNALEQVNSQTSAFIAKLDTSGNHVFSAAYGATGNNELNAVAVDDAGNIAAAGDFDGSWYCGFGCVTTEGLRDIVVTKLSPTGALAYSKTFGNAQDQSAAAVTFAKNGHVVVGGAFHGLLVFGGSNNLAALTQAPQGYVVELDGSGTPIWSEGIFGVTDNVTALAADSSGGLIVAGSFGESAIFFGQNKQLSGAGGSAYVAKFDSQRALAWAKALSPTDQMAIADVATDASGNVLLTGYYDSTATVEGTALAKSAGSDLFVAKYAPSGEHLYSHGFGDPSFQTGTGIAALPDGSIVVSGAVVGSIDFGKGLLVSSGDYDAALAKFAP